MPAPTALQKPAAETPLPDTVDEILQGVLCCLTGLLLVAMETDIQCVDAADEGALTLPQETSSPTEADFISPDAQDNDDAMAVDEESRPKFAPARDIVRLLHHFSQASTPTFANMLPHRIPSQESRPAKCPFLHTE